MSTSPKNIIYQVAVNCNSSLEKRVKKFCRLSDQTVSKFAAVAFDNEIDYQLSKMPPKDREVIETLLKKN